MGTWTPGPASTSGNDVYLGDETDETVDGLEGDDALSGLGGADVLSGGDGADRLNGGEGVDTLSGGQGNDVLETISAHDLTGETFDGGLGDDALELIATNFGHHDWFFNTANVLSIEAITFSDDVAASSMAVHFNVSQFSGGAISNGLALTGASASADAVYLTMLEVGSFSISGWTFSAWSASDHVYIIGANGGDTITGGSANDVIVGGAGNDEISGGAGDDILQGDAGDDTLSGGGGADLAVFAGNYDDYEITEGAGFYAVSGVDGFDTLYDVGRLQFADRTVILGDDVLNGGEGDDTILGLGGNDTLSGLDGADLLEGGAGNDHLSGDAGDDDLLGGAGEDHLIGGVGDDTLDGGDGNDILASAMDDYGYHLVFGFDVLRGGAGNDVLHGHSVGEFYGGAGDDILRGSFAVADSGDGDDNVTFYWSSNSAAPTPSLIDGGAGTDSLTYDGNAVGPGACETGTREFSNERRRRQVRNLPIIRFARLGITQFILDGTMRRRLSGPRVPR